MPEHAEIFHLGPRVVVVEAMLPLCFPFFALDLHDQLFFEKGLDFIDTKWILRTSLQVRRGIRLNLDVNYRQLGVYEKGLDFIDTRWITRALLHSRAS
jgi:hypothetical protein